MVYTRVGTNDTTATLRYGDQLGENGWWRAWIKGSDHRPLVDSNGDRWDDGYEIFSGGFRGDVTRANGDRWNLWGQAWDASIKEDYFVAFPVPPYLSFVHDDTPKQGGILSGSWEREDGPDTKTRVQAWWVRDHYQQVDFDSAVDSLDLDFSRTRKLSDTNQLVWGLGYRLVMTDLDGIFTLTFDPEERNNQIFRTYVQDQISFPSTNLTFTLGAALQHNDFTGFEFQPNLAGLWQPSERNTLWASVSRAVRTPSLEERDSRYNIPVDLMGTFVQVNGSSSFQSESVVAYEAGWRWQATSDVFLDLTGFFNDYDELQTFEAGTPFFQGPNLYFPYAFGNKATAESWGAELALDWDVRENWRIRSAYTYFRIRSAVDPDSTEITYPETDGSFPENQLNLRSYYDLTEHWELDAGVFYVDDVPYFDTPAYTRFDLRLGYNPTPDWKFSVGVQNAFNDQTPEEGQGNVGFGSEVPRVFYVNLTWSK
jgi:iron complex outermembrane receptor protein